LGIENRRETELPSRDKVSKQPFADNDRAETEFETG